MTETNRTDPVVPSLQPGRSILGRITRYFKKPRPEHTENAAWNHPITNDADGLFRVYLQNKHGVARDAIRNTQDLESLRDVDVSCFCLTETNLDWTTPYIQSDYLYQQRRVFPFANTAFSSIHLPSTSDYRTGGTLTSAVGKWCTRVSEKEEDPSGMGRWSALTFVGKKRKRATIITAYRCVRSNNDGSVWTQEQVYMRTTMGKTSPHPRRQFIEDLIRYIQDKVKLGHEVLVCMDANEVLGEESQGIARLIRACNLHDCMNVPASDGTQQLQDTYRRGKNRRIDFMLGTQTFMDARRRYGALAYNDGIASDHRGLYCDFDPQRLLGGDAHDPVSSVARNFTSKNAKKSKEFVDHLERYLLDHRVPERVNALWEEAKTAKLTRKAIRDRHGAIDRDITRGMTSSDKKTKKGGNRKFLWSEDLDRAGYQCRYWKIRLSDFRHNSHSSQGIANVLARAGISDADAKQDFTEEELIKKGYKATADLHEAQKNDKQNRNASLKQRLKEAEEEAQTSTDPKAAEKASKAIESIIRTEHRQESHDRIRYAVTSNPIGRGLERLDIPKRDDNGNEIVDATGQTAREILLEVDDIHAAIIERNKQHFHQATDTPFGQGILMDLVGYSGLSEAASDIVDGIFLDKNPDTNLLPETRQLILEMAMPAEIRALKKPITTEILESDFIDGFKKWKERTSTSPSGRHLGLYKAIINDYEEDEDRISKDLPPTRTTNILDILVKMTNLPLRYGFAPTRWCRSITVMIEKDPGSPRIERLRIIHLFEADYNFVLKQMWARRLVYCGEDNNCFNSQQFGSRPGHQAIDAVHKKTLSYDLSRILLINLAMLDNDATGCYDRIVISLAMICALRLGMPRSAVRMHSRVITNLRYFVKTAHGISDHWYKAARQHLLFGTGQGSGASPAIWLSIVSCLLSGLSQMASLTMKFIDPWQDIINERSADSYVDDTSIGVSDANQPDVLSAEDLVHHLQSVSQTWERLLYSSGGALELRKCFWYLIYWSWIDGRPVMANKLECPAAITLTCGHNTDSTTIVRKEPWEAMRTLGVRPAPNGNFMKEAAFLKTKADTYASRLLVSNLTRMDTFIFHRSTYVPSLTYSLPVTTLSKTQLNKIQTQSVRAILEKLGVNRNFPRRVTFGPREFCGLFLMDMSVEQGVRQIQHFMNHVFAMDSVGELIIIELRSLQLESGCGHHLLEAPSIEIPYLTPCWVTSMRTFMAEHRVKLEVTKALMLPLCRAGDRYLMDDFRQLQTFSADDLYDINRCRIHLQVTTLSDIVDGLGRRITSEAFTCTPLTDRSSSLIWPRQPHVTTKQRNLWKKALESAYTSTGQDLHAPLGNWHRRSNMQWQTHYDPCGNRVIRDIEGRTREYLVVSERRLNLDAHLVSTVPDPPESFNRETWIPVTVESISGNRVTVSVARPRLGPSGGTITAKDKSTSFEAHVMLLPEQQQRLLRQFEFVPGGQRALKECLQQNQHVRIASDGSLDQHRELASFGWLLISNGNVLVRGSGPVDGVPDLLSSTRAELFGMGACLELLHQFCSYFSIIGCTSKVTGFVDNQAAIKRVNRMRRSTSKKRRVCHDLDIVTHIHTRLTQDLSTLKISFRWVKAHQDDKKPYSDLDLPGRMNVDADYLAERFRKWMEAGTELPIQEGSHLAAAGVSLSVNSIRINSHYMHKLRVHIQGKKHRKYLQKKHEWTDDDWQSIDWRGLKNAFLILDPLKRISCSKRIHGWLNTGEQKAKICPDATDSHKCPRCHTIGETQDHVLTCRHASAHKKRFEILPDMTNKMIMNHDCTVQHLFVECFRTWLANPDTPFTPDISHVPSEQRRWVAQALQEQARIGWSLGSRGYLSKHWAKAVAEHPQYGYDKTKNEVEQGQTWARRVIHQLWEFGQAMWHDRNRMLHDPKSDDTQAMKSAAVDAAITKLYENVDTYAAEDRQFFDLPLVLRLRKRLRAKRRWLALAKTLASVSTNDDQMGQTSLTAYFRTTLIDRPHTERHEVAIPPPSPTRRQVLLTTLLNRLPSMPARHRRLITSTPMEPTMSRIQPTINSFLHRRPQDPASHSLP